MAEGDAVPKAAKGAGSIFTKQVGPLPVGVWVILVVGGLGMAYYFSKNQTVTPEPDPVSETTPQTGVGNAGEADVTAPVTGQPTYTTNEEWGTAALNWAIARGYDPNLADTAIRKYLSAAKIDTREAAVISDVLRYVGAPPVALPPAETDPPRPIPPGGGTPIPSKPKPKYTYQTVYKAPHWSSTLGGISKHYYGNSSMWGRIYVANRNKLKSPFNIRNGLRLYIPYPTHNV